jgi:hypothetical protein
MPISNSTSDMRTERSSLQDEERMGYVRGEVWAND